MARIPVVQNILSANAALASDVRERLDASGVFALNMMASPGAGKTSFITATIRALGDSLRVAYVDGDIETTLDAERVDALGVPAVQINTGGSCHLDANMLSLALPQLPLDQVDLLIVNKMDLLPYVPFDLDYFKRGVEVLSPGLTTFEVSCTTGNGIPAWVAWLKERVAHDSPR
jgi:hydrogenase nickel incorporation protein HypB